ncbi:hypothetical protein M3B96_10495 [Corynebacterium propinquum]|uniref:hypothetical protein n=1 Tax=Corynebacterium propinquum TaxID=43769 RepID=UPI00223B9D37|nr:hypothetical protein [Corynebacterium propinquum]MCT1819367.1 hypothetical protein [Corynebacterium propinquum]
MSNPTFVQGPISCEVAQRVEKFTLVTLGDDGKIKPAGATGPVFGAVTEIGAPKSTGGKPDLKPDHVAVHYGPAAVKLKVAGGDASAFKPGKAVYAAANGEVSATGTSAIGVAVRAAGDRVLTVLNGLPTATAE